LKSWTLERSATPIGEPEHRCHQLVAVVLDNTVMSIALKTISEVRGGLGASQSQLE
jgi:hypothetical protein